MTHLLFSSYDMVSIKCKIILRTYFGVNYGQLKHFVVCLSLRELFIVCKLDCEGLANWNS